jgi:hypothetical protein
MDSGVSIANQPTANGCLMKNQVVQRGLFNSRQGNIQEKITNRPGI